MSRSKDVSSFAQLLQHGYTVLGLRDSARIRPPLLTYRVPVDEAFLAATHAQVSRAPNATKRLWKEWRPSASRKVEAKDEADGNWASTEDLKVLNDACTKWCTRTYFPDAFARVNMVVNVIRLYDRLRATGGLRGRIVFKGGVMIRLVLLEFLKNLSLDARLAATDYVSEHKALSISDFDFEIVPDNHAPSSREVHRTLVLTYAVLLWLQRQMQRQMTARTSGLVNMRWNPEAARAILLTMLQEAVDATPASHALHGSRIDRVYLSDKVGSEGGGGGGTPRALSGHRTKSGGSEPKGRDNVVIFDCGNNNNNHAQQDKCVMSATDLFGELDVQGVPTTRRVGGELYATLNTYIGEDAKRAHPGHYTGAFHLARIKHAFVVYYTTRDGHKRCDRLGGEMIDLSQSAGVQLDTLRAMLYANVADPYADYPLLRLDPRDVTMRSYSIEGFLYDHRTMLHHTETPEPWKVNKFEKRLLRYLLFLVAHVLGPHNSSSHGSGGGTTTRFVSQHARKLRALQHAVESTRSVDALLRQPALSSSGHKAVDRFLALERQSVAAAAPSRARTGYVRTLHSHLAKVVGFVTQSTNERWTTYVPRVDLGFMKLSRFHARTAEFNR